MAAQLTILCMTCIACFAHSTHDGVLHVNRTLTVTLILHVRLTLSVPFMLIVTHLICTSCIMYLACMLHMPLILHVPHKVPVPCALCVPLCCMFILCCVCPVSLFQLIPLIRHFKPDLSLPPVLTVSTFSFHKSSYIYTFRYTYVKLFKMVSSQGRSN